MSPLLIFVGKALCVAQIPNGVTVHSNFRKGCIYEHVNTGQTKVLQRELRQAQDAKKKHYMLSTSS